MSVIPHSDLSHVLVLLVGGIVPGCVVGGAIVFEDSGAQRRDGQRGDENDDNDCRCGDTHGVFQKTDSKIRPRESNCGVTSILKSRG